MNDPRKLRKSGAGNWNPGDLTLHHLPTQENKNTINFLHTYTQSEQFATGMQIWAQSGCVFVRGRKPCTRLRKRNKRGETTNREPRCVSDPTKTSACDHLFTGRECVNKLQAYVTGSTVGRKGQRESLRAIMQTQVSSPRERWVTNGRGRYNM